MQALIENRDKAVQHDQVVHRRMKDFIPFHVSDNLEYHPGSSPGRFSDSRGRKVCAVYHRAMADGSHDVFPDNRDL